MHSYGVALPTCNEIHHVSFMTSHHLILLGCFLFCFCFFPIFGHFVAVCAYLMQISKFKMNFKIQTALNTHVFSYFLICWLSVLLDLLGSHRDGGLNGLFQRMN